MLVSGSHKQSYELLHITELWVWEHVIWET
jgi:hypothetical protein